MKFDKAASRRLDGIVTVDDTERQITYPRGDFDFVQIAKLLLGHQNDIPDSSLMLQELL